MASNKNQDSWEEGTGLSEADVPKDPGLEEIRKEFLRFAPAYAQPEAEEALDKIIDFQSQGILRNGLYYLVLVDLVGSSNYIVEHGNDAASERIQHFVRGAFDTIKQIELSNIAIFVKEIGDAVLMIFQCFPDIIRWQSGLEEYLDLYGGTDDAEKIRVRTCVHVGDVILSGVNPISLAVSQLFKFEKDVDAGEIGLSDPAYRVAWPTLARAYHAFEPKKDVGFPGTPKT